MQVSSQRMHLLLQIGETRLTELSSMVREDFIHMFWTLFTNTSYFGFFFPLCMWHGFDEQLIELSSQKENAE